MSGPITETNLASLLGAVLNPNNECRAAAEAELDRLSYSPVFWEQLCAMCTVHAQPQDASVSRHQLVALSVVKQKLPLRSPPSSVCAAIVQSMCRYLVAPAAMPVNVLNQMCAVIAKSVAILEERCDAHVPSEDQTQTLEQFSTTSGMILTQVHSVLQDATSASPILRLRCLILLSEVLQAVTPRSVLWCDAAQLAPLLVRCAILSHDTCLASTATVSSTEDENSSEFIAHAKCGITAVSVLQDLLFRCLTASGSKKDDVATEMTRYVTRAWSDSMDGLTRIALTPGATLPSQGETLSPGSPSLPHPLSLSLSCSTLALLTDGFASRTWYKLTTNKNGLAELCHSALTSLQTDVTLYDATTARCPNDDEDAGAEATRLFHMYCGKRWQCLSLVMVHTPVRAVLQHRLGGTQTTMTLLWLLLFAYSSLTDLTLASWEEDANAFLRDEDASEDGLGASTRDAAVAALQYFTVVLGPGFLVQCLEHTNEVLFSVGTEHATLATVVSTVPSWPSSYPSLSTPSWRFRETALFCFEFAMRHCTADIARCGPIDLLPVLRHVVTVDTAGAPPSPPPHPVQFARALSCVTALLPLTASSDATSEVLARAVSCVSDCGSGAGVFVQLAACKLLLGLITSLSASSSSSSKRPARQESSLVTAAFAEGHRALLHLLTQRADALSGESLSLVLDTLARWLTAAVASTACDAAAPGAPLDVAPPLPQVLFDTWRAHIDDPNLCDTVASLMRSVVICTACDASLAAQVTWMDAVVCGRGGLAEQCVLPSVIRILSRLFRDGSPWLADTAASCVLANLCELLLRTEESAVLDASANCLAALLKRCPQAEQVSVSVRASLVQAAASQQQPSLSAGELATSFPLSTVLVGIALHLLREDRNEATLFGVGPALRAIAQAAPHCTEDEIRAFLLACARRLTAARTDTVAVQLLTPLALLAVHYPDAVCATLTQGEDGLLSRTLTAWCAHVPNLARRRDLCLSSAALLALRRSAEEHGVASAGTIRMSALCQGPSPWLTTTTSSGSTGEEAWVPLSLGVFVTLGRVIVRLAGMDPNAVSSDADSDEDKGGGGGLFLEDTDDDTCENDGGEDDDDDWADEGDEADTGGSTATTATHPREEMTPEQRQERQAELVRTFSGMLPLVSVYCPSAAALFKPEELSTIQSFFTWIASLQGTHQA